MSAIPYVLLQDDGPSVWGVLLAKPLENNSAPVFTRTYLEPAQVSQFLAELLSGTGKHPHDSEMVAQTAIKASTLDLALAATPESDAGQKHVFLYRDCEWFEGIWNSPTNRHPGLTLWSVGDSYGGPVSVSKRATRPSWERLRGNAVVMGDYDVLLRAVAYAQSHSCKFGYSEAHPGAQMLAAWWNAIAPSGERSAAFCRLYAWDEESHLFEAADWEEPPCSVAEMGERHSWALFEKEGYPVVIATFMRGAEQNRESDGYVATFYADGETAMEVGADLSQIDEAYYCVRGLKALAPRLGTAS